MVLASPDKSAIEIDITAVKDELKRSVLLEINCQADNTPESRTEDGYKTHLGHLNKRLKSNVVYTACMIGQCLTDLKRIYHGNNKLLIYATKHLFAICYVYFFVDFFDLVTTLSRLLKHVLMIVFFPNIFYSDFSVVSFSIVLVTIQELNDLGYPIHFTRYLSAYLFNTFSIRNVPCAAF